MPTGSQKNHRHKQRLRLRPSANVITSITKFLRSELLTLGASASLALISFYTRVFGPDTIGNDYTAQVGQALQYRYFTKLGIEPLWYPHISGGESYAGLALSQIYHLPAWLISFLPYFWNGEAMELFLVKTMIMFFISQFVLYITLNRLFEISKWYAFTISVAFIYTLRNLDSARFGTSMDANAYYVLSACLICFVFIRKKGTLFLPFAFYLFISAGYAPMSIFGGTGLLILVSFLYKKTKDHFTCLKICGSGCLSILLSAPIVSLTNELVKMNHRRTNAPDLKWANESALNIRHVITNLFSPWASDVQSSFGGSTLLSAILILSFIFPVLHFRKWANLKYYWVAALFFFIYSLGDRAGLFTFMFNYLPGFHWVRIPPRILNAGLPLIALFWGMIWSENKNNPDFLKTISQILPWVVSVAAIASTVFYLNRFDLVPDENLPLTLSPNWNEGLDTYWFAAGLLFCFSLLSFLKLKLHRVIQRQIALAVIVLSCLFQIASMISYGTWVQKKENYKIPTLENLESANHLPLYPSYPLVYELSLAEGWLGLASVDYFNFRTRFGENANCVLPLLKNSPKYVPLPFYFTDSWICGELPTDYRCSFENAGIAFLEKSSKCNDQILKPNLAELNKENKLIALGPGSVTIKGISHSPTILVAPYSFGNSWQVTVNGEKRDTLKVDHGILGVAVPAGENTIRFDFLPPSFHLSKTILYFAIGFYLLICLYYFRNTKALAALILILGFSIPFWPLFQSQDGAILLHNGYQNLVTSFSQNVEGHN